jgi:hypothetical protein
MVSSAKTEPIECTNNNVNKTINEINNQSIFFILNQNSVVHI